MGFLFFASFYDFISGCDRHVINLFKESQLLIYYVFSSTSTHISNINITFLLDYHNDFVILINRSVNTLQFQRWFKEQLL